jgi:hypothetical protein
MCMMDQLSSMIRKQQYTTNTFLQFCFFSFGVRQTTVCLYVFWRRWNISLNELMEKVWCLVEGDNKKNLANVVWELVDVFQPVAGAKKETCDLVYASTANIGNLELGDLGDKQSSGYLSVRKEMIHHKDEKEGLPVWRSCIDCRFAYFHP